uniref:Uncharacterized protein n=1 Tax=Aegilops tauschii subsp. strangulata TaxID=200361 RepID=A0A453M5R6_AEGTS
RKSPTRVARPRNQIRNHEPKDFPSVVAPRLHRPGSICSRRPPGVFRRWDTGSSAATAASTYPPMTGASLDPLALTGRCCMVLCHTTRRSAGWKKASASVNGHRPTPQSGNTSRSSLGCALDRPPSSYPSTHPSKLSLFFYSLPFAPLNLSSYSSVKNVFIFWDRESSI